MQSSDVAIAVSGTIVLETTLASLPTVVIYRANRLTEWVVQWLTAVRFVSVPNLMLGRLVHGYSSFVTSLIHNLCHRLVQNADPRTPVLELHGTKNC